jgi:hypothetical protein
MSGDECWVYGYDSETKQMSSQWNTAGIISSTEESVAGEVQCQDHVDFILQH